MAGTGLETATSHSIFVTQYGAGYYDIGNNHSGRMWQNGTHYWADNSKNWYWMCQYYYDNSGNTNNQPISTFYY